MGFCRIDYLIVNRAVGVVLPVSEIREDILEEFAKHDNIDFAYPTWRFF